jgi:arylsulfatase
LELAGTAANDLPGESLLGLWSGKKNNPRTLYWEHEGNKAIRKGNLKLVRDLEDPAWELYDLSKDPAETNNLAAGKPGLVNDMIAEYQTWAKRVGVKGEREKVRSEK